MKSEITKRIILTGIVFLILGMTVNGQNSKTAKASGKGKTTMKNQDESALAVARKMFEAFNRHDAKALSALYADDVFADAPDYPQPKRTPAEIEIYYADLFKQSPDAHDEVKAMHAAGNHVFIEFTATGTIENPAQDLPPTAKGKKFELKIATVLEIKNGKIVRDVSYYDQMTFLDQLGMLGGQP